MHQRSLKYIKQVKATFVLKAVAMLFFFLSLRYSLGYLGAEKYGVWATILTVINWIIFFDLGIANGVKNKVSEAMAKYNIPDAKEYISTGYLILSLICTAAYIIFYFAADFVPWGRVFNTDIEPAQLILTIKIIGFFIFFNFILSIVLAISQSIQQFALVVLHQCITQFLSCGGVIVLYYFLPDNLVYIAVVYGFSLVLASFLVSLLLYKRNIDLLPNFKSVNKKKIRSILGLGWKFFILQLTALTIVSTDRFIIVSLLGPADVSVYDVLFRYFSVVTVLHGMINAPLWAIYTEAYSRNDHVWIQNTLLKLVKLVALYIVIVLVMIVAAKYVILIWLGSAGQELSITLSNYLFMGGLVIMMVWSSIFTYFSNGIEKINSQIYASVIGAVINIPLSIYFIKHMGMGINGAILATIISLAIFGVIGPFMAIREIRAMRQRQ